MNSMRLVLHKRAFAKIRAAEQQRGLVDEWSREGREMTDNLLQTLFQDVPAPRRLGLANILKTD